MYLVIFFHFHFSPTELEANQGKATESRISFRIEINLSYSTTKPDVEDNAGNRDWLGKVVGPGGEP